MATTYTVELADGGKPIVFTGPEDASEEHILYTAHLMLQERNQEQQPDPSTIASRALGMADAGLSFASGAANTVAGGIAGAVATPFAGAETGANIVNAFTNTIREPATPEGQKTLADAGVAIKSIIDQLNVPLASVGSFIEIMTGQGLDKAVETFSRVKEEGAGIVAGERVLEETGSPLLATAARITPEAIIEVVGAKGLTGARGLNKGLSVDNVVDPGVAPVARQGADPIVEAVTGFAKGVKDAPIKLADYQSPKNIEIAENILAGTGDKSTAGVKLKPTGRGTNVVVSDSVAKSAIKQGFDEKFVAMTKLLSPEDRAKFREMINHKFKLFNSDMYKGRASDVVGDSLVKRYQTVRKAMKKSGQDLENIAKGLKGKTAGVKDPIAEFMQDLLDQGVTVNKKGKLDFEDSRFEANGASKKIINAIYDRVVRRPDPDALQAHNLKVYIDDQVTYGKNPTKAAQVAAQDILKKLRRGVDSRLDAKYDDYNKANITFSETKTALDKFEKAAGKSMEVDQPGAVKDLGTKMRRLTSNSANRGSLEDVIDQLDTVANKYGGDFKDSVFNQAKLMNQLESMFGSDAGTSFLGQMEKGVKVSDIPTSTVDAGVKVADAIIGKVNAKNPEKAFKALIELMEDN